MREKSTARPYQIPLNVRARRRAACLIRARSAATPASLSSIPPGSDDDEAPVTRSSNAEGPPARGPRMVASIVDPSVNDALALTGPGAPGAAFSDTESEHPVRARLLARARGEVPTSAARPGSSIPVDTTEPWVTPRPRVETRPVAGGDAERAPAAETRAPTSSTLVDRTAAAPADVFETSPPSAREARELHPPNSGTPAPPPAEVAAELERIAGHHRLSTEPSSRLSPNLTALLGGLLGLTVMGALGIFMGRLHGSVPTPPAEPGLESKPASETPPTVAAPIERKKVPGPWRIDDDKGAPGVRIVRGTIGKLPFLKAIEEAGVPKSEAYRVYAALKDVRNLDRCGAADQFRALLDQGTKKLKAFEYLVTPEEVYQAKSGDDGLLHGQRLDLKVERNQVRRAIVMEGASFEDAARKAGFDPGLGNVVEKALAGHMLLGELRPGDRLRVIAQEVTVLGEFSRYAGVEAIELVRAGKPALRFYYFNSPGQSGYFDLNGRAPFEGGWRKPITTAPVTSRFNMKRMHPVLHKIMPHNGTDFGAATGTPIGATAPGTISFIGPAGPSGNLVKVKHAGGYESGYAHLSRYVATLHVGDPVERMQVVGYVGSTGRSTGPHLHFTMRKDGVYFDAESLNLDGMRVLPPSMRAEFAQVRAKYDPILDAIPLPAAPAAPVEAPESAVPAGSEDTDPTAEEDESPLREDEAKPRAMAAPTPPAAGPAPPASTTPPTDAKPAPSGNAIFLSDGDLLKMQSAKDDGEVRE